MKRFYGILLILVLVSLLTVLVSAGCQPPKESKKEVKEPSFPLTLTDDGGREVTLEKEPQRIVSLTPGNTEILYALGLEKKVVGVTTYCDYPARVKSKEKVGDFANPNVEKIVALKPDLVLATAGVQAALTQRLDELGVPIFIVDPKNLSQSIEGIKKVGKITGQADKAEEVTSQMEQDIEQVSEAVASVEQKPTVFCELGTNPLYTAGTGTFIDDMIRVAGGVNVVKGKEWVVYSIEQLIKDDPDIYIAVKGSMHTPEEMEKRQGFKDLSAVKNNQVYVVDDNLVTRPGPRLTEGLKEVAKAIHPKLF